MNGNWKSIERHLNKILGEHIVLIDKTPVSGGCINQCWKVTDSINRHWFIKTNSPTSLDMFLAEADGLEELYKSQSIRTPQVIGSGKTADLSYLILEYFALQPTFNQEKMGFQLATMHHFTNPPAKPSSDDVFGWKRDNTIGATLQKNQLNKSWVSFLGKKRLLYQLNLAKNNGYSHKAYDSGLKLIESLLEFFSNYQPKASLLHGDLWGGNCAGDANENPVIYDPAVYYGDRETDIAMTELFGGFNAEFYAAYNASYALDAGYKTRKTLYNLYHILNHFNLFRGGYASQAERMTLSLLSEIAL